MKDFLKYLIVFVLLTMIIWSHDRPKQNANVNFGQKITREIGYIKRDFESVKKEIVSVKKAINFIDNLPTK